jgi:hypothetical protein
MIFFHLKRLKEPDFELPKPLTGQHTYIEPVGGTSLQEKHKREAQHLTTKRKTTPSIEKM